MWSLKFFVRILLVSVVPLKGAKYIKIFIFLACEGESACVRVLKGEEDVSRRERKKEKFL